MTAVWTGEDPGYLLGFELRPDRMADRALLQEWPRPKLDIWHRETCPVRSKTHSGLTVPPFVVELAFEAERQRNRTGGPRTVWFCDLCVTKSVEVSS